MLDVCLSTDGKASGLQAPHTVLQLLERHHLVGLHPHVAGQLADLDHPTRDLGLELRFAAEDDHGANCLRRQEIQHALDRPDVPVVLEERVLELESGPKENLSPPSSARAPEEPSAIVLGFNHEHAEAGHQDVIHLSRAVIHGKGDVVHQVVVGWTKLRT